MSDIRPDGVDIAYGPHPRNVFDIYRSGATAPAPWLLYIHGGGFKNGDKERINQSFFREVLARGISIVSISYRLSQHAIYPAPFHDCRLALQFLRLNAGHWGLDPVSVAAAGSSAGAGMSLWLAFRPDMAEPESDEPALRQSTRLACVVTFEGQTSYDPRFIERVVGGKAHTHPVLPALFGVDLETWPNLDEAAASRVEDGAAINFLDKSAPPVFSIYKRPNRLVKPEDDLNFGIHHPAFGYHLQSRMDALGLECTVLNDPRLEDSPDLRARAHARAAEFLRWHLHP